MPNPAGMAAAQSLILLLESLMRIPVTFQLLIQSQITLPVKACCQVWILAISKALSSATALTSSDMHTMQ